MNISDEVRTAKTIASLVEGFDWSSTALGMPETWPEALVQSFTNARNSKFGVAIYWGPERINLYNDAMIPMIGDKHPRVFGRPVRECWPEVWDTLDPLMRRTLEHGESFLFEDRPITIDRYGYPEETFFTFGYTPIDDGGSVGGMLVTAVETTASMLREREFHAMADTLSDIVFVEDSSGRLEWVNSRWHETTGFANDRAVEPADIERVMHPEDLAAMRVAFADACERGTSYHVEARLKPLDSADASYRWHTIRSSPIRTNGETIVRYAGSATDVHDLRENERLARERLLRELTRERDASLAFQSAALPLKLPNVPDVTFDWMYEAAAEGTSVGGDWYDVFCLPDGRVAVSIGDVIGNGLAAAVTMSAVRQAIRGAATMSAEPSAILDAVDRVLRSEQSDRLVTAFLGVIETRTRTVTFASAGHPSPFLRDADGNVTMLECRGLPLGLRSLEASAPSDVATLPDRSLLVLYTDGLTEATHDIFEGERRMREAIAREDIASRADVAYAIRRSVPDIGVDDIAILTVRFGSGKI